MFKPFVKFLRHFKHSKAVSQIFKPCPMYLSHFPNILAISQISKSFSTFLSLLSVSHTSKAYLRYLSPLQHTYAVPQILKACPIYLSHFPNIWAISQISKSFVNYFSSNSSHEKSPEYQRMYRNRSVGAETPARLVALEVLHKFSFGYSRFCGDCDSLEPSDNSCGGQLPGVFVPFIT